LKDLAKLFITKYYPTKKIKINTIGLRPGEKLTEELFSTNDLKKQILANDEMFILTPEMYFHNLNQELQTYQGFHKVNHIEKYSSVNSINLKKIREII